ncbi:MAG: hypothetical protein J5685_13005 [Clostridiales bacterium]|nr:hypothetical protein [Clostridiales bacterium]
MKKMISLLMASTVLLTGVTACSDQRNGRSQRRHSSEREEESEQEEEETGNGEEEVQIIEARGEGSEDPETGARETEESRSPMTPVAIGNWEQVMRENLAVPGLWTVPFDTEMTDELDSLFDSIRPDLGDDQFTPLAMVEYQQSTGDDSCNYCFLCKGVPSSGAGYWCLVYVHDDGSSRGELCNVYNIVLPGDPDQSGIWTYGDSETVSGELLDCYNSAFDENDLYYEPLAYLGERTLDGVTTRCFLTDSCLYMFENDGLALRYISDSGDGSWSQSDYSIFETRMISGCPDPVMDREYESPYAMYTYGGWSTAEQMDLSAVPQEVLDHIRAYDNGRYEPCLFVTYKELLNPVHKALLRVLLCSTVDGFDSFVFVEEDEDGNLSVTGTCPIDIDAILSDGCVNIPGEDPADTGWELVNSSDVPEAILDKYWEDWEECMEMFGVALEIGTPEFVISSRTEGDMTTYSYVCRQDVFHFGSNGDFFIMTSTLDSNGSVIGDNESTEVIMSDIYDSLMSGREGAPSEISPDEVLDIVYETTLLYDADLAADLMDEANVDGNTRHANTNGMEIVIETFDSEEEAVDFWNDMHDTFRDYVVIRQNNYFLHDSMGSGNMFFYCFHSGNCVVTVMTADIMNVTTVADIGDTLVEELPG